MLAPSELLYKSENILRRVLELKAFLVNVRWVRVVEGEVRYWVRDETSFGWKITLIKDSFFRDLKLFRIPGC